MDDEKANGILIMGLIFSVGVAIVSGVLLNSFLAGLGSALIAFPLITTTICVIIKKVNE